MTCIVGVADGTTVHMGADSMITHAWTKSTYLEGKIWRAGEMLFGGCGQIRPLQVIRHHLTIPQQADTQDTDEYLVATLVPAVMEVLHQQAQLTKSGGIRGGGSFMLGYRGELYSIGCDMCVTRYADGYGADGSGTEVALGSLFSSKKLATKQRLTLALEAASYHGIGVGAPFQIETV